MCQNNVCNVLTNSKTCCGTNTTGCLTCNNQNQCSACDATLSFFLNATTHQCVQQIATGAVQSCFQNAECLSGVCGVDNSVCCQSNVSVACTGCSNVNLQRYAPGTCLACDSAYFLTSTNDCSLRLPKFSPCRETAACVAQMSCSLGYCCPEGCFCFLTNNGSACLSCKQGTLLCASVIPQQNAYLFLWLRHADLIILLQTQSIILFFNTCIA